MPNLLSHKGVWHASQEEVGGLVYKGTYSIPKEKLPKGIFITGKSLNPGQPYIYKGPDRAALKLLEAEGKDMKIKEGEERKTIRVMGRDFRTEPEFLQSISNMRFNSVDEYLKNILYDEEADDEKFRQRAEQVESHELPQRVKAIEVLAGGRDDANPENSVVGGFGDSTVKKQGE